MAAAAPSASPTKAKVEPGWGRTLAYAGYALPAGLMVPPFSLLLPAFYAQVMGVSLGVVGTVVGGLKIYDLIFNPILGVVSDRTRTRFGRRRPWMLAGVPLLAIGLWLTFAPPVAHANAAYLTVALLIYYTGSSLVMIPYYALGAETPATPYGRARMLGLRETVMMAALIFAGLCPLLAQALHFPAASRQTMLIFLIALAVVTPPALAGLLLGVPDRPTHEAKAPPLDLLDVFRDFRDALVTNKAFARLVFAYAIINFAIFTEQSIALFFLSKVLLIEKVFSIALLVQGSVTVLAAPVWVVLARRFELHRLIAVSVILACLFRTTAYSLLPPGQPGAFLAIQAVGAALFAGALVLSSAIQASAIEHGTLATGRERAGVYTAANTLISQIAGALPFMLVLPLLQWSGFSATGASTPHGLGVLRFIAIYGAAPFQLFGAWLLWRYPISKRQAAETAAELMARRNVEIELGALAAD